MSRKRAFDEDGLKSWTEKLTLGPTTRRRPRMSTRNANILTWGDIKGLTLKAEQMVKEQGQPVTTSYLFLAMLALNYRPGNCSRGRKLYLLGLCT